MRFQRTAISLSIAVVMLMLVSAPQAFAQDSGQPAQQQYTGFRPGIRRVVSGQKTKLKGRIVRRDADTFSVLDDQSMETIVLLTDRTSVKSKGGFSAPEKTMT